MRFCSNQICRRPIGQAFGTTKAGDWLEVWNGMRKTENVRELCEICSTKVILICEVFPTLRPMLFDVVGWHNDRLLPAPNSS